MSDALPALTSYITHDDYPQVIPDGEGGTLQLPSSEQAFRLDPIAWRVWSLLPLSYDIADLCSRLAEEFAAPHDEIVAGALPLLERLAALGLIAIHPCEGGSADLRRR